MIKLEMINSEDITTDVLFNIAQEILKDCTEDRAKEVKETLHKAPSLESMKDDLEIYQAIVHTLVEKIKEEEDRRKKNTHHLIEKKVRTTTINDEIVVKTNMNGFATAPKSMTTEETFKYVRDGNKIICTIDTPIGRFKGVALQHHDDEFNYESGMTLAKLRARKEQYRQMEREFAKSL